MINQLSGVLIEKSAPFLVIDVNGVGYEVQASLTTFTYLPSVGEPLKLLTHLVVREDAQLLYGFATANERLLFRTLIKVNNVGPKLALAILSGMDAGDFARCVLANDIVALTRLPGVGKKTAERLVIEMKDRLKEWHGDSASGQQENAAINGNGSQSLMLAEAETALVALGYKPVEASKALAKLDLSAVESSEDAIRAALKNMINR